MIVTVTRTKSVTQACLRSESVRLVPGAQPGPGPGRRRGRATVPVTRNQPGSPRAGGAAAAKYLSMQWAERATVCWFERADFRMSQAPSDIDLKLNILLANYNVLLGNHQAQLECESHHSSGAPSQSESLIWIQVSVSGRLRLLV
jgi:hypothetical protein